MTAANEDMTGPGAEGREHLGEALDSMALLLLRNIQELAAPPACSPFARARGHDAPRPKGREDGE